MTESGSRPQLVTCLWSNGQAEEAARFYVDAFSAYRPDTHLDEVRRSAIDVVPGGDQVHLRAGDVLTVSFTLDGQRFVALNDPARPVPYTDAVSLQVLCGNQEEVDHFWSALTAGGGTGVACGWLQDRFGMRWQVVPTVLLELLAGEDRDAAARVQRAMMGMVRLSIEGLMDAAQDAFGAEEQ
ncbi:MULTISPECIES: VOC family protein [Citricoccus]|uniref:VOC family protein n=1 Tax=Citricoccus TaxID=169133 RepID=UPI000255DDC9|nr:VOC family protein [Citricoccus sp. CH26A]